MKITALGVYGRYAPKNKATNSYLVQSGEVSVLLDCGSGAVSKLESICGGLKLDAVILTHLHGDHCADFLCLQYRHNYLNKTEKKFAIYLPKTPQSGYDFLTADKSFEYIQISDKLKVDIKGLGIQFFKTQHPVETYGVRFSDAEGVFAYTSDNSDEGDYSVLDGADLVIGDACVTKSDEKCVHIAVENLAEKCKDKVLVLAHLDKFTEKNALVQARKFCKNAKLAKEKAVYYVKKHK